MGGMRSNNMHQAHEYIYICVYITNVETHTHLHTYSHTQICLYVHYIYIVVYVILCFCVCVSLSLSPCLSIQLNIYYGHIYYAHCMLLLMATSAVRLWFVKRSHLRLSPCHTALLEGFLQRLAPGVQDHIRRVVLG